MLETFDNAADIEDRSDDFKTLHKIYTYLKFNKFKRTVEGNVANKGSQTDFPSLSSEGITGIDIANINEFVYCDQVIENINDVENITILNGHESTGIPQLGQISVTQTYTVINDKIDWPSENILTVDGNMDIPEKIQKDFEFVTPSCTKLNPTTQAYTPMEDILDWPQTPLRKGSKVQKNKKSFVITNSLWIEDEERRKEDKRKIEYLKEERKAERIKKKALKENGKITKKNPKATSRTKQKTQNNIVKLLPTAKKTHEPTHTVTSGALASLQYCSPTKSVAEIQKESSPPPHVRKLFSPEKNLDGLGTNFVCRGKMCYECTKFMSGDMNSEACGIRCTNCTREYHIKCLKELKCSYLPSFACNSCLAMANSERD